MLFIIVLRHKREVNLTVEGQDLCTENYKTLVDKINEKTSRVYRLEESISLRCLYYPEPSKDSMQSLSIFQWHFHRKKKPS